MEVKSTVVSVCGTNSYMLWGDDFAVLIDVGEIDNTLIDFAYKHLNKPNKAILLTHCHFDHIGGVEKIKALWDCDIIIGKNDAEGLMRPEINLSGLWSDKSISIKPDKTVSDNEEFQIGSARFRVIETAGHTKGSVVYIPETLLFSGDTLFKGSVGRYDLPTSDYKSLMASIEKLYKLDGDFTVLSGHGPQTTLERERRTNPYMANYGDI